MSKYIDFDYSTKGLAINLPNGTIKSDQEGCLICDLIVGNDISNNSISLEKLDQSILSLLDSTGFVLRVGSQITSTIDLSSSLAQFYTVAMTSESQTITLPTPTSPAYLGERVTFKRKTNTTAYTLTAGTGTPFIPISSITAAETIAVATTIFQVDLICDGTNWCIIGQV